MEVEEQKKRIATQEEKRSFLKDQLLSDFLNGNHSLSKFVGRTVLVKMEEEDQENLLDRLMKIPEEDKTMVFHTLNSLVLKTEQVELRKLKREGKPDAIRVDMKQLDMVADQKALQDAKKDPTVRVLFKHLSPPSKAEGGWLCKNMEHPQIKAWYKLFQDYPEYVLQGSRNGNNVAFIWEHSMPLDYAVMISPFNEVVDLDKVAIPSPFSPKALMRFVIYEPYKDDQQGFNMYITPVKK